MYWLCLPGSLLSLIDEAGGWWGNEGAVVSEENVSDEFTDRGGIG